MTRRRAPSELARLGAPLARVLDGAWRRTHWWLALLALLYAGSGITVIRPDEIAVVLRWGRLVGDAAGTQIHGPGLLFALPRPVDQVVRVKTKYVWQLPIESLSESPHHPVYGDTLDPLLVGYALTGDQNVVHVSIKASYRVRDPADWAFYGPKSDEILRVEVDAAMVRSLGEMGVDHVLSDGRKLLIAEATRRAQAGLDAAHSGLALVSLELIGLRPPSALASDFDAVQSAFIESETNQKNAQAYAQDVVPRAHASADAAVQVARADAAAARALANGETSAFLALHREYSHNPAVVRERLYRDAVEKALGLAQAVRWIPPASKSQGQHIRVMVAPDPAGARRPPSPPLPLPQIPEQPTEEEP
jgi:membrane protease subunit HflK